MSKSKAGGGSRRDGGKEPFWREAIADQQAKRHVGSGVLPEIGNSMRVRSTVGEKRSSFGIARPMASRMRRSVLVPVVLVDGAAG